MLQTSIFCPTADECNYKHKVDNVDNSVLLHEVEEFVSLWDYSQTQSTVGPTVGSHPQNSTQESGN